MKKNEPPSNLSPEARKLWRRIIGEYRIDDAAGLALLATGLEALDRIREAQVIIRRDGLLCMDRFNRPKQHPAVSIESTARAQLLSAFRALRLDPAGFDEFGGTGS